MQLYMHADKRGECKQQLDAVLQQSFSLVGDNRLEQDGCSIHVAGLPRPHGGADAAE